jgi:hypothetical protein
MFLAVVTLLVSAPAKAQVFACRGYPSADMIRALKIDVEALRRIEREAADRLAGLDTRTYDWLLDNVRKTESEMANPALLEFEDSMKRCRNYIRPVHRTCAAGATALVRVIAELAVGEATREAKSGYAQAMPQCERWVGLRPLDTGLRDPK